MKHTACKNKQMPYKMHIFGLCLIKNYAKCICKSACYKKNKPGFIHRRNNRTHTYHYRPSHYKIQNQRRLIPSFKIDRIKHNSKDGTKSIYTKQSPSQCTTYQHQTHRYVAAENQHKYRTMVKNPEHSLCTLVCKRMVKSGK